LSRNENAILKKLRKQQEASLAEVLVQKEELLRWVADEKARTAAWCGEQRQMALKERNTAAKLARDSRQRALSSSLPVRKEKSELEALQATIEKMKIDHEAVMKKSKANEHRLYSLVKDHTTHLEANEKQRLGLEQDKLMLLEFISEQGIRLPKSLRSLLQKVSGSSGSSTGQHPSSSGAPKTSSSKNHSGDGYAEEVDVEDVGVTSKTTLVLDDESVGFMPGFRRGDLHGSSSLPRSATVGQSGSNISSNLSSTQTNSRLSVETSESHELHPLPSRPSNEAKIVDNYKSRLLTSSATDSRGSAGPNSHGEEDSPKSRTNDNSSKAIGSSSNAPGQGNQSKQSADPNRIEEVLPNGTKLIRYKNGTLKEVDPSGDSIVRFLNGDSKQYRAHSGIIVYYYALADTTHTTHPDGLEIYEFPNKQASYCRDLSNCTLPVIS